MDRSEPLDSLGRVKARGNRARRVLFTMEQKRKRAPQRRCSGDGGDGVEGQNRAYPARHVRVWQALMVVHFAQKREKMLTDSLVRGNNVP
jgi:hypothetical protein